LKNVTSQNELIADVLFTFIGLVNTTMSFMRAKLGNYFDNVGVYVIVLHTHIIKI